MRSPHDNGEPIGCPAPDTDGGHNRATKILTVTTSFPYPPDDGTRIQIYHRIRQLASGNDVTLLCVHDEEIDPVHLAKMEEISKLMSELESPELRQAMERLRQAIEEAQQNVR